MSPPHPKPMKRFISPLNFPKPIKLSLKAFLKNHSKSQKNRKMENSILLDFPFYDFSDYNFSKLLDGNSTGFGKFSGDLYRFIGLGLHNPPSIGEG
jgi:hypothetical protein